MALDPKPCMLGDRPHCKNMLPLRLIDESKAPALGHLRFWCVLPLAKEDIVFVKRLQCHVLHVPNRHALEAEAMTPEKLQ